MHAPSQNTSNLPEKILQIKNSRYAPAVVFVAFIPAKDSLKKILLMRYPAYDVDINPADYILSTRQWFKDANDTLRRKTLSWQENINGETVFMGLSKPHETLRRNSPNQRTFWVEVPLKDRIGQSVSDRMYFCIDFVLKE